jgi:hypothetical protein
MIRFISRIVLVTTFFIGLGAVADTALNFLSPGNHRLTIDKGSDCQRTRFKMIKVDNGNSAQRLIQFRMILPNLDQTDQVETIIAEPIARKKVVIVRRLPTIQ